MPIREKYSSKDQCSVGYIQLIIARQDGAKYEYNKVWIASPLMNWMPWHIQRVPPSHSPLSWEWKVFQHILLLVKIMKCSLGYTNHDNALKMLHLNLHFFTLSLIGSINERIFLLPNQQVVLMAFQPIMVHFIVEIW